LLIFPDVNEPLPIISSPIFNFSLSLPNTTTSPSLVLTTSKSFSDPLTLSFSPGINGDEFIDILKVGYWFLGINLPSPFDSVTAIPVFVDNPTTSNLTLKGFGFGFPKGSGIDTTLKNWWP